VRTAALTLIGSLLAALAVAACGSGTAARTPRPDRSKSAGKSATRARPSGRSPKAVSVGPPIGATQTVHAGASTLRVRLVRVIDPLRDSGADVLPGKRAVGVIVQIDNLGPAIYDSSSTTDISLQDADGLALPVFVSHGPCQTALQNWDNYMYADETRSGCVSFQVGAHVALVAVRFSPHGSAHGRVLWSVGGR
jgi:hypothetical protein